MYFRKQASTNQKSDNILGISVLRKKRLFVCLGVSPGGAVYSIKMNENEFWPKVLYKVKTLNYLCCQCLILVNDETKLPKHITFPFLKYFVGLGLDNIIYNYTIHCNIRTGA